MGGPAHHHGHLVQRGLAVEDDQVSVDHVALHLVPRLQVPVLRKGKEERMGIQGEQAARSGGDQQSRHSSRPGPGGRQRLAERHLHGTAARQGRAPHWPARRQARASRAARQLTLSVRRYRRSTRYPSSRMMKRAPVCPGGGCGPFSTSCRILEGAGTGQGGGAVRVSKAAVWQRRLLMSRGKVSLLSLSCLLPSQGGHPPIRPQPPHHHHNTHAHALHAPPTRTSRCCAA